jgi:low affinity Fe/Cu permease
MDYTYIIVILIAVVCAVEIPQLVRRRLKWDLAVYIALMASAILMGVLYQLRFPVPNPVYAINDLFAPVGKWIGQLLS